MGRATLKNVVLAVIVVLIGVILRSIDALASTQVWKWSLGQLVGWLAFTVAAATAAYVAGEVGRASKTPLLGSPHLARVVAVVVFGVALWLLRIALKDVLIQDWAGIAAKVFAFAVVALAIYAVWVTYRGFDEIASVLGPRAAAAARVAAVPPAKPPAAPTTGAGAFCGKCGASIPPDNRFCDRCGAARPE